MWQISNARLLVRIVATAVTIGTLGFVCGFLGPFYLLRDPGVGPVTGIVTGPLGAFVGGVTAVYASVTTKTAGQYLRRVFIVAAIFGAAIIMLIVVQ